MYAMVCTRPYIAHAVGIVTRFLANPGKGHWEAVKWIFKYLRGTSKLCLSFGKEKPVLVGYTHADMAGDLDGRKSTSCYLFTFVRGGGGGGAYHGNPSCKNVWLYPQRS